MPWGFYTASGVLKSGEYLGSEFEAGTIVDWAGTTLPVGWLFCDGAAVSRTTYSKLFNIVGTAYGSGDGSTTFNVPNATGKIIYATPGLKTGPSTTLTLIDSQTFTSSTTYTISSSAKIIAIECIGAGAGGAGGGKWSSAANTANGGPGGNGGGVYKLILSSAEVSGTVTVTIGAGGAGGAGQTVVDTGTTASTSGGTCRFGNYYFPGASGWLADGNAVSSSAAAAGVLLNGGGGGLPSMAGSSAGYKGFRNAGGGGGAGGMKATSFYNYDTIGQAGGSNSYDAAVVFPSLTGGGGAGGAANTNGSAGVTAGHGGGGGGYAYSGTCGNGAAGAVAGGGGGGGGGGANSINGGAGGAGGRGEIKIWVYG